MNINPPANAVNLISTAQQKTAEAAHEIATFQVANDEVGSPNFSSTDLVKPLLSLKEAELETSAAVKVLQAENERIDFFIWFHLTIYSSRSRIYNKELIHYLKAISKWAADE